MRSAGGAWMPATHPDRPAMTGGQTPHRFASLSRARLAFIAHPRLPRGRVRYAAHSGQPARCAVRRPALPGDGKRSPLRRSTWDFWPGPVLAVIPSSAFAKASAELREPPVCDLFVKASRGSLGSPSGIVRLSSHGSSLPGGAGLADLPGAVASRIGDATASPAIQGSPHEAPLVDEVSPICS